MPKGDCGSQISRAFECARSYSRGNTKLWLESRLRIRWLWDEDRKPRLSNRSNESTKAHQRRKRKKKELRRDTKMWNSWLWRWSKGLSVKESRSPLEAEKDHALDSPLELPLETWSYQHLDIHLRLWTFRMPKQTVFSHCGHGNLLQQP